MRTLSIALAMIVLLMPLFTPLNAHAFSKSGGGYVSVPLEQLLAIAKPGDLIIVRGDTWYMKVAGYWHHVAIYIGNGYVVEALSEGVVINPVSSVVANRVAVGLFRVRTIDAIRLNAVRFALAQVGKPYDYGWLLYPGGKQVYGSSYYCSELAWASYLASGGPDIDANPGFTLRYGYNVAPDEVATDGDVYLVALWSA